MTTASASQPGNKALGPHRTTRILLVEDDPRLRRSTAALLESVGYEVEAAVSGERAIALYAAAHEGTSRFDLVLMDQTLGGPMGGVETLRVLRSIDSEVCAVMLSGRPASTGATNLVRHGFVATLSKPIPLEALQRAIEAALDSCPCGAPA